MLPALALCVFAAPSRAQEPSPLHPESVRLLERVRRGDPAQRIQALERLAALGERARPVLEAALGDPDPDVRLHVLYLLHAPEGRLERRLRLIVEGRPTRPGATYPAALRTFRDLRREATPGLRDRLLHVARRTALRGQSRLTMVCLELWSTCLAGDTKGPRVRDIQLLGELFALELGDAADGLLDAVAALPPSQRLACLRGAIARSVGLGAHLSLARAARAVGEVATRKQVVDARRMLSPLLRNSAASVRREAVRAWGLLAHGSPDDLIPVVRLTLDADPEVAQAALRLVGEYRVHLGREAAERVARDSLRPSALRQEAVRTLGLLADPVAQGVVLALAKQQVDPILSRVAAWALGAMRAPGAHALLVARIEGASEGDEPLLYNGLARLGGDESRRTLLGYLAVPSSLPRQEAALTLAHARMNHALRALGHLRHVKAASDLAAFLRRPRSHGGRFPEKKSLRIACEALADRGGEEPRKLLLSHLLHPRAFAVWEELLQALERVGPPGAGSDEVVARAVEELVTIVRTGKPSARELAARALSRIAPPVARSVIGAQLRVFRGANDLSRTLGRCMGLLGQPQLTLRHSLPYSEGLLAQGRGDDRIHRLNNVGIDQLYARRYAEAWLCFQRMRWVRPKYFYAAYNSACSLAHLGRPDDALRLLRRAIRFGSKDVTHLRYDHDLVSLRRDPRFQRLIAQLHLARETEFKAPTYRLPSKP